MPTMSPGYIRNVIRRCFREVVDRPPSPDDVRRLWQYFDSSCAFCGARLDPVRREGHLDHLVPAAGGGGNHLSNRVLSCASCNSKEKSNQDWEPFLLTKCGDSAVFELRQSKIRDWIRVSAVEAGDGLLVGMADAAAARVIAAFDAEVDALRQGRLGTKTVPRNSRRTPVRDTNTGEEYPSLYAAGKALAELVHGDPTDHYVWYAIERAFPSRFETLVDGKWTKRGAS